MIKSVPVPVGYENGSRRNGLRVIISYASEPVKFNKTFKGLLGRVLVPVDMPDVEGGTAGCTAAWQLGRRGREWKPYL